MRTPHGCRWSDELPQRGVVAVGPTIQDEIRSIRIVPSTNPPPAPPGRATGTAPTVVAGARQERTTAATACRPPPPRASPPRHASAPPLPPNGSLFVRKKPAGVVMPRVVAETV